VRQAHDFRLSQGGLYQLAFQTALSRYVGLVEVSSPRGPILDVLADATETNAEAAARACVRRAAFPKTRHDLFNVIAKHIGAGAIS
jgi:hypothetical protein